MVTSPRGAGSALHFSSSEEGEYESVEVPPPVSPQYEELFEVMTRCCGQIKHQVARPRSILSCRTANLVNAFCEQSDHLRHGACRSSLISTLRFRDCGHRDRASPLALLLSGPRWQAALLSQRQTCRPCFRPRRPRRSPDAHGPGLMRVAPAGGERFSQRFPHQ